MIAEELAWRGDTVVLVCRSRERGEASRTGGYKIDFDDLMLKKKYSAILAASQSKLAQVMFTLELAQRLEGTGVTVNALHPGLVKSGITRELPFFMRTMLNLVSTTPEKGARTALYLATSPEVENVSGQYIGPKRKPLKLAAQANEPEARRRLWDLSVEMTALRQAPLTNAASPRLTI